MRELTFWGVMCLAAVLMAGCGRPVEIIAHRGASYSAPENTLAAVMLGWDNGADVEVDVHLTRDNRIVVIHDKTTKRTAGEDLTVSATDSEELRRLDVGRFKSDEFAGEKIPFLEEVISTIPPGRKLYVEIKCRREILGVLGQVIGASGKRSQVVMIAFDFDTIAAAKKRMPDIDAYWLKGTDKNEATGEYIRHDVGLVEKVRAAGLDGLDVHYAGVGEEFAAAVKQAGLKLYVWTVDDAEEAMRLCALGADGITTNRPEWLKRELKIDR